MERRDFLTLNSEKAFVTTSAEVSETQRKEKKNEATLLNTNLTREQAAHLLRRIHFGVTPEELDFFENKPISEAVDILLGDGLDYLPANASRLPDGSTLSWKDSILENPQKVTLEIQNIIKGQHNSRYGQFISWWLDTMRKESANNKPVMEKLSLFWHSHWCIGYNYDGDDLIPPPLLFRNLNKIRMYRLGNFKKFAEEMTLDGAYLLYQSLNESTKGNPNENYMRELMELFTMGIGNYSEGDIREGARALTGWRVTAHLGDRKVFNNFDTYFSQQDHDITAKSIMGEPIIARTIADNNIDKVRAEEVVGILNILFNRRPQAIAEFIANKLYLYYIYSSAGKTDESFIKTLASSFRDNNFELRPMFKTLFTSDFFYDPAVIGNQIKTPAELFIGLERLLNTTYTGNTSAISDTDQMLFNPPDVAGWKGYRTWINTKTYPQRVTHCKAFLEQVKKDNYIAFAKSIKNYSDINVFLDGFFEVTLPKKVSESRKTRYLGYLQTNGGMNSGNWASAVDSSSDNAFTAIKAIFKEIILEPDFQLI